MSHLQAIVRRCIEQGAPIINTPFHLSTVSTPAMTMWAMSGADFRASTQCLPSDIYLLYVNSYGWVWFLADFKVGIATQVSKQEAMEVVKAEAARGIPDDKLADLWDAMMELPGKVTS